MGDVRAGRTQRVGRTPKNGHASATPATDGERIYVSFGSRGLFAFDMDGKLVWQRDLGRIDNYHGAAGSPLLYKDRVILYQDQSSGSFIAAFDARTGEQVWRTSRDATVGWGTPIAVRVGDHDEIIVNGQSARARLRSGHGPRAVALQRQHVRSDSDAGRRLRDGVLLIGPRRPDAGDPARAGRAT